MNTIENKLRNIDPDVFNANYTRKCIHPPTYIEEDEVQENINNGKKVMMFPKEITKDSIPKNYICNYDDYKYPGLRNNPFDNAKIFPFIPCCYKKDQSQIKGSRYRNYYFDEPVAEKDMKQQGIYVSNIILPNDKLGCTIFATYEDIMEGHKKMILLIIASIMKIYQRKI